MAYTSIAELSDRYGNRVFQLYESTAPAGLRQRRNHRHAEFEVSLILHGCGRYSTSMGEIDIREGDVFLFSSNEYHNIIEIAGQEENEEMRILNVHFLPGFFRDGGAGDDRLYMNVFLRRTPRFSHRLDRDCPALPEVRELLLSLRRECIGKEACYVTAAENLLVSALILIARRFGGADLSHPVAPLSDSMDGLQKALSYINSNFAGEISLDAIAAAAGLSRFRFAAGFRASYNMTTWDYINLRRIERARELLSTTDDTVLSVATRCGYNNTANFNRIFRKVTGITPREYRAAHRAPCGQ